jgi:hypothetical protein
MRFAALAALILLVGLWSGCERGAEEQPAERPDATPGDGEATRAATDAGDAAPGPRYAGKAVFAEREYDFGDVYGGATLEHVFKVRNAGQEVLHIEKVSGS